MLLPYPYKSLIDSLHKKCKDAVPHKREKCLPWQPEWFVKLYHYNKRQARTELIGDLRPDNNPVVMGIPFLTEKDAQEFCDALIEKHDEWAKEERRLSAIAQREYAGFRAIFPTWGMSRAIK